MDERKKPPKAEGRRIINETITSLKPFDVIKKIKQT